MRIIVTGAAGFIGYHVANRLLDAGGEILGIDDLNAYYPPSLKRARLERLLARPGFRFERLDIGDGAAVAAAFSSFAPRRVVHLAAQAGVRLDDPATYVNSNLVGFTNVLQACRLAEVDHLLYASSSSVYGGRSQGPFSEADPVDHPVSLYAATKKANELLAHAYSHMYGLPTTGVRFFTVYGPWGRPDMAYYRFAERIMDGKPIEIYGDGAARRDFTYIDDIVEGVVRLLDSPAAPDPHWSEADRSPATSLAPFRVYNLGNRSPVPLEHLIETLERVIGKPALRRYAPAHRGDVAITFADTSLVEARIGFEPNTPFVEGLERFVAWLAEYHAATSSPEPHGQDA